MKVVNNLEEFAELIDHGNHLFFFTADWCGDCRFIHPVMPEIEADFPEWEFVQVDRDQFIEICQKWDIFGIPSFVAIRDGKEVGRLVNKARKSKIEIEDFIRSLA